MEVINPIIMAGAAPGGSGNQPSIYKAKTLVDDYSEWMISYYFQDYVNVSGPLLYILKPGDYTPPASGLDTALLQQYAVTKGEFSHLYLAGSVAFKSSSSCMNFCATYDKDADYHYMHCDFYVDDMKIMCYLPILDSAQGRAGIALNGLYGAYIDCGKISMTDLSKPWRDYTTLDLSFLHLEE